MSRPSRIPPPARRLGALAAGLVLAVLVLTGCGSSDKPEGGATPTTAESAESSSAGSGTPAKTVGADGTITATEAEFSISIGGDTVAAGPYLVKVENAGQATHDLVVEQNGTKIASTSPIAPGQSASLSVTLKPGTYVFYCSIGNHRAMGMEMTVHVA